MIESRKRAVKIGRLTTVMQVAAERGASMKQPLTDFLRVSGLISMKRGFVSAAISLASFRRSEITF